MKRARAGVFGAAQLDEGDRASDEPPERVDQATLADARLSGQEKHGCGARESLAPRLFHLGQLGLSSDQRRKADGRCGLDPTRDPPLADDLMEVESLSLEAL